MPDYKWPDAQHRTLIGKRITRVDSPVKLSGRAKYTYDQNPQGLLFGKVLGCPHAHAKVVSVDTSAAEKMPGVKAVKVIQGPGKEVFWQGDDIVAVAAVDEPTAEDALRAIKVEYQVLPHFVDDQMQPPKDAGKSTGPLTQDDFVSMLMNDAPEAEVVNALKTKGISFQASPELVGALKQYQVAPAIISAVQTAPQKPAPETPAGPYKQMADQTTGDPAKAFQEAEAVSEGLYGLPVIAHCCLETHGTVCQFTAKDNATIWMSTQGVSGVASQFAEPLGLPAANIHVLQQHVGGGFGSKLGRPDPWGLANADMSRAVLKPIKLMLDRADELQTAGSRPSVYARVRVGARKDGTLTAWESDTWGTGGIGNASQPPLPYVFTRIPNQHKRLTGVNTNQGPVRAWRAPNHPQACLVTMCALEDLAAKLNLDPVELLLKNLTPEMVARVPGPQVYREELMKASELMGWKQRWHPRGDKTAGPLKRGLGVSIHTWGGAGHSSNQDLSIHPDGTVEIKIGTQDLGTGTRTVILTVAAETLGIPMDQINLLIGDSHYPPDGASGGSTTVGGVSSSTRRAAVDARDALFEKVAPSLNAQPADLESVNGVIRVKGAPGRSLTWKQACAKLGPNSITVRGKQPDRERPPELTTGGMGGAQMAEVEVDTETGIVRVRKMVAVQDCGLIISLKTAESQMYGAMIMGISYSLYEEKIMDPVTGIMLNNHMDNYRLAGYGDIPEIVVHMMTGPGYDERGVIGLGEPPVVSPGAAISNAVANAIGVRVPFLPLTPDRVLAALERRQA